MKNIIYIMSLMVLMSNISYAIDMNMDMGNFMQDAVLETLDEYRFDDAQKQEFLEKSEDEVEDIIKHVEPSQNEENVKHVEIMKEEDEDALLLEDSEFSFYNMDKDKDKDDEESSDDLKFSDIEKELNMKKESKTENINVEVQKTIEVNKVNAIDSEIKFEEDNNSEIQKEEQVTNQEENNQEQVKTINPEIIKPEIIEAKTFEFETKEPNILPKIDKTDRNIDFKDPIMPSRLKDDDIE